MYIRYYALWQLHISVLHRTTEIYLLIAYSQNIIWKSSEQWQRYENFILSDTHTSYYTLADTHPIIT